MARAPSWRFGKACRFRSSRPEPWRPSQDRASTPLTTSPERPERPERPEALVAPLIQDIVQSIHEALAIAIASTFWVSIGAALVAAVIVLFMQQPKPVANTEQAEPAG